MCYVNKTALTMLLCLLSLTVGAQDVRLESKEYQFGSVSIPVGWFTRVEDKGGTLAFFASVESIENGGMFKTGLTVTAVKDVTRRTLLLPTIYSRAMIDQIALARQRGDVKEFTDGKVRGYYALFKSKSPDGDLIVQVTIIGGNNDTGTVYIVTFESPEAKWLEAWKLGDQIIKSLKFNQGF